MALQAINNCQRTSAGKPCFILADRSELVWTGSGPIATGFLIRDWPEHVGEGKIDLTRSQIRGLRRYLDRQKNTEQSGVFVMSETGGWSYRFHQDLVLATSIALTSCRSTHWGHCNVFAVNGQMKWKSSQFKTMDELLRFKPPY